MTYIAPQLNWLRAHKSTLFYIATILIINVGYTTVPFFHVFGSELSIMDPLAGIVYLVRDFAQRELGHRVLLAMLVGIALSYLLSEPMVARASVCAFFVGEMVDWLLFTFSGQPLSERLLWSSMISAPLDSLIFLLMLSHLNPLSFSVMSLGKAAGIFLLWFSWRQRRSMVTAFS